MRFSVIRAVSYAVSLVLTALLGTSCEPSPPFGAPIIGDSLGIAIVDHGAVDPEALPKLRLEAEPLVSIGVVDGPDEYQFYDVIDAHRRRDGSIAVLDRSRTIRVFDSLGVHVWTAGSEGDGPGEFRRPQRVAELAGDTLVVWDGGPARFSLFVDPGKLVRTRAVAPLAGSSRVLGLSNTDRLVVAHQLVERGVVNSHSAITVNVELYLLHVADVQLALLGRELLVIQYQEIDEGGAYSPAIFEAAAVLAPAAEGFWYGDAKRYELRRTTVLNGVDRIVRWQGPDRAIDESDFDAVLETWAGGSSATPEMRQLMRKYGRSHPRAEQFPSYEELLTDAAGGLWVREFVRDHEDDGLRRWTIFSPDGTRIVGRLEHGANFRPLRVDRGWVLGVERGELDVERIVLRRVTQ